MSYLVLARKWRPQNFADVVGQQPVVRTLQNALKRDRVAHAMIFSGVRGVGKTTLARIMAKALNCKEGPPESPCNQCDSCREITTGTAIDLHEIDGASNRGIQEIRELKENIRFFPTKCRYKIIIIDEVHMLTTEAFNALLKTLEEPPAHVFFMFATTELHKIPITILSRCQRYELRRIPFAELVAFFKKIAGQEKVAITDTALEMIGREAEGSVRDGLSLLDQIFSYGGEQVTDEDVTQVLGLVDRRVFELLAGSLLAGRLSESLEILDRSYAAGVDLKRFAGDLLAYFRALLICKTASQPAELLDVSDQELASLQDMAAEHTAESLYHYFHLHLQAVEEMQYSPHPRLALEMAFIKAAQTGQVVPVSSLLARLDGVLKGAGAPPPASAPPSTPPPAAPAAKPESSAAPAAAPAGQTAQWPEPKGTAASLQTSEPEVSEEAVPRKQASAEDAVKTLATDDLAAATEATEVRDRRKEVRKHWDAFVEYVKDRKQWMSHVLRLCSGTKQDGGNLTLKFDAPSDCKVLQEKENLKLLAEFAQDFFQQELKIRINARGAEGGAANGENQSSPQEERRALANDPLVRMTTEVFGGEVVGIRTGPRSR